MEQQNKVSLYETAGIMGIPHTNRYLNLQPWNKKKSTTGYVNGIPIENQYSFFRI
jgi:hypothetical protein